MPFGLLCSPFILKAVILRHLKDFEAEYPETVKKLRKQLYFNDWLGGDMSVEEAENSIRESNTIFKAAKMELCKWTSNSTALIQRLPEIQFKETVTSVVAENKLVTKTVGVIWDQASNKFRFDPMQALREPQEICERPIKRKLFSLALKIFDLLGLIAPVTFVVKLIM